MLYMAMNLNICFALTTVVAVNSGSRDSDSRDYSDCDSSMEAGRVTALWQYLDSRTRPPLTPSQTVVPGLEQRLEGIYSYSNVFFDRWSDLM